MADTRLVFITDPMCSWCWGMAQDIRQLLSDLAPDGPFEADLMLGGINTHGTQPIGDYGRRYLFRLWREVEATTGQHFSQQLPDTYVHNSTLPCCAIEVVRQLTGAPPFEFLHDIQQAFFTQAINVNDRQWLTGAAARFGVSAAEFSNLLDDPAILQRVKFQFDSAGQFGTQALPSVLIEHPTGSGPSLLAGGYVDAPMLKQLINSRSTSPLPV